MQSDDRILVQQSLADDQEAFAQLVKRHSRRVFHILQRFFNNPHLVEDIAQEVFLKAYTSLKTYRHESPFENWLSTIALHECYRHLQKQRRQQNAIQDELDAGECEKLERSCFSPVLMNSTSPEQKAEMRDLAEKVLLQLSPKEHMVLILLEVEELSLEEVARLLGVSAIIVKVRAFRARRHAQRILQELSETITSKTS
jgi:RNA polymerase sigma-70 factor (ECF subfamily)